jgi:hypothetical protein
MVNLTTKPYNEIDKAEFNRGFDRGNYASNYETETGYQAVADKICGENGFYRIGHLLGFFSSFEIHEIPENEEIHGHLCKDEVEKYRKEFRNELGWI